jgi:Flp pilus assembly protein TadD
VSASAPVVDANAAKRKAKAAVSRGRYAEGVTLSRAALELDGTDAETYVYLGAALQELGKWREASQVFSDCVRQATRGPVGECRKLRR